jgi:hypothetical protein
LTKNKLTPDFAIQDEIHCPFCKLPINLYLHLADEGHIVITYDDEEKKIE